MPQAHPRLEKIASGFMNARVLLSAVELDLFTALGADTLSADEVARRTHTAEDPVARLLNALVALKIVIKKGDRYRNTAAARCHLVAGAPEYLGDIMRHRASMWESWSNLTKIVRTGTVPPRRRTKKREKAFIKGMANIGVYSARETVAALKPELSRAKRLIDVGGGPATYACAFAAARPGLRVTVLDLPGPLTYARETIAETGMEDRVTVQPGDVRELASFGRGYDVVFLSNFIHCFKRPVVEQIIAKAGRALFKGGCLAIKEFFIKTDRASPPFATLFSINMLTADAGDCFSRNEVSTWMESARVKPKRFTEVGEHSGILIGKKQ